MNLHEVELWVRKHHAETADGLVDKPPSSLCRGEGTVKYFYIMKADIADSTKLLQARHPATYLRLAHTFLSTVDKITQYYGADAAQAEYAGDGLMAYFPAKLGAAESVLKAAFYVNAAVAKINQLSGAVGTLQLRSRMVIHYAPLTVAVIGPRADSFLAAIGLPLHHVSKIEKEISAGVGRATKDYYLQLQQGNRKFFTPVYTTQQVPVPAPVKPFAFDLGNALRDGPLSLAMVQSPAPPVPPQLGMQNLLAQILREQTLPPTSSPPVPPPSLTPTYETKRELIGYDLDWGKLNVVLQ